MSEMKYEIADKGMELPSWMGRLKVDMLHTDPSQHYKIKYIMNPAFTRRNSTENKKTQQVIGEIPESYYVLQVLNLVCFVGGHEIWGYFIVKIKLRFPLEEIILFFFQKKLLGSIFLHNSELYYPDVKKSQWQSLK